MAHYPKTPGFTGTVRPVRFEGDIHDVEIEGELPPQLDFGVTQDYAVFHVVPIVSSWERLRAGLPHLGFRAPIEDNAMSAKHGATRTSGTSR
jgi:hypothetical protein